MQAEGPPVPPFTPFQFLRREILSVVAESLGLANERRRRLLGRAAALGAAVTLALAVFLASRGLSVSFAVAVLPVLLISVGADMARQRDETVASRVGIILAVTALVAFLIEFIVWGVWAIASGSLWE